MTDRFKKN